MSIPLSLVQQTINYIVKSCEYNDSKHGRIELTGSYQRNLAAEMLSMVWPLNHHNLNCLVIGRGNKKLQKMFELLEAQKIVFPEKTTFLLYSDGVSYQKSNGQKLEIVNLKKSKNEVVALQKAALKSKIKEDQEEVGADLSQRLSQLKIGLETPPRIEMSTPAAPVVTHHYEGMRRPITLGDFFPTEWQKSLGISIFKR